MILCTLTRRSSANLVHWSYDNRVVAGCGSCARPVGCRNAISPASVGAEYYTFISQLEAGRGRIPPDRYTAWAKALEIDSKIFVQNLLRFYDPMTHAILFGDLGA